MKSPLSKLCCISNQDTEPADEAVEIAQEAIAKQPESTEGESAVIEPHDVSSADETKKGHTRTPSEASAPVAPTLPVAPAIIPQKTSRSSSSTSSFKSSESVLTAIERTPTLIREDSKESVVTAIESTPSLKAKKEDEESKAISSQEVEVSEACTKTAHEPPTSEHTSQQSPAPESKSSQEPLKGMSSDLELPEDVTTLDEVNKLNEMINGEKFDLKHPFWDKISLFYGDITKIQVDAIVNAANDRLGGGGGVDGAIHRAAGHNQLQAECRKHDRPVPTGEAVVTDACKLSTHVKKIIHCVGPICYGGVTDEKRKKLESCYRRAIQLSEENDLRSIAFCCISTGIYGYDNKDAARTVLRLLWKHFSKQENAEKWDRVVLCLFMEIDKQCYKHYMKQLLVDPSFFDDDDEEGENEDRKEETEDKKEDKEETEKEDEETNEDDGKKDRRNYKTEEKKDEDTETNEDVEKIQPESKESMKTDDKESEKPETKDSDEHVTEKGDDIVSESEIKADKGTGEGQETKKEEASTSTTNTSTSEGTIDEPDGGKHEGEKENHDNGEEKSNNKRGLSEDREEEPPIKKDKYERESAV